MRIFLSYSRRDADIADRMVTDLEARGIEVDIDRRDLPYGEEWQAELARLIRAADTIVWLASAASVTSQWCRWELGEAQRNSKRLLPVRISPLAPSELPEALGRIHVLPAEGIYDPAIHLDELVKAIETDRAWMETHTRLGDRATEWIGRGRSADRLLRGKALRDAELWRDSKPDRAPAPGAETLDLLLQSRRAATRGLRVLVALSVAGFVAMAGLAGYAVWQADVAQKQTVEAQAQRGLAQGNAYRNLASLATASQVADQPRDAIRLALAAWPRSTSSTAPWLETSLLTMSRVLAEDRLPTAEASTGLSFDEGRVRSAGSTVAARAENAVLVWKPGAVAPLRLEQPTDVADLELSDDGTHLAIVNGTDVQVWDLGIGRLIDSIPVADAVGATFSTGGTHIATWSRDGVMIWNVGNETVGALASLDGGADSTQFSSDGKLLAMVSGRSLRLIRPSSTEGVLEASLPSDIVGVAFSDDGSRLVAWCADRRLRQFSTAELAAAGPDILFSILPIESPPADEPDGVQISIFDSDIRGASYVGDTGRVIAWSADGTLRMWDAASGNSAGTVMQHDHIVSGAVLTRDRSKILSWSEDGTLKLWDAETGLQLGSTMRNGGEVDGARLFEDQGRILSWSRDGTVRLWTLSEGQQIGGSLQLGAPPAGVGLTSAGAELIAVTEAGAASLWDVSLGAQIGPVMQHVGAVDYAYPSEDGTRILAWGGDTQYSPTGDKRLRIWSAEDGRLLGQTPPHLGNRMWAMLRPDERVVLTMTSNAFYIWDAYTAEPLVGPVVLKEVVNDAYFWPEQHQVITASGEGIRYWNETDGSPVGVPLTFDSPVYRYRQVGDGNRMLVQTEDGALRLVDTASRKVLMGPMLGSAESTSFIVNDRGTIAASFGGSGLQLWDLTTGKPIGPEAPGEYIYDVSFALGDSRVVFRVDSEARVLDTKTGQQVGDSLPLEQLSTLVISPDGQLLLTSSSDNTGFQVWDLASNLAMPAIFRTERSVSGAEFNADGTRLLMRHALNYAISLWDVESGLRISPNMYHGLYNPGWRDADGVRHTYVGDFVGLGGATFLRDGKRALSWSKDGSLKMWNIDYPPGNLIEVACARLSNADTVDLEGRYRINITDPICTPEQRGMPIDWSRMELIGTTGKSGG